MSPWGGLSSEQESLYSGHTTSVIPHILELVTNCTLGGPFCTVKDDMLMYFLIRVEWMAGRIPMSVMEYLGLAFSWEAIH